MKIEQIDNYFIVSIKHNNMKQFPRDVFFSNFIFNLLQEQTLVKEKSNNFIHWENHFYKIYFKSEENLTAWRLTYSNEIEEYEYEDSIPPVAPNNTSLTVSQILGQIRPKMSKK